MHEEPPNDLQNRPDVSPTSLYVGVATGFDADPERAAEPLQIAGRGSRGATPVINMHFGPANTDAFCAVKRRFGGF